MLFSLMLMRKSRQENIDAKIEEITGKLEHSHLEAMISLRDFYTSYLSESEKTLRERNRDQLDSLLSPLHGALDNLNRSLSDSRISSESSSKALNLQIDRLLNLNNRVITETRTLSSALKGNNRIQGEWGETILESLLQKAGMQRGVNYDVQVTRNADGSAVRSEEGGLLRPDFIIHLPQNRNVIIDSKVNLTAYMEMIEAEDEQTRKLFARRHVEAVKRQIDSLSSKNYQKAIKDCADQVLLFIPNEGAYCAALSFDSSLWEYAFQRNITVVSSAHLFGILHLIQQLWRSEKQDKNAREIAKAGNLLYESAMAFLKDMENIDRHLSAARDALKSADHRLSESNRGIKARAERLRDLSH